MMNKNFKKNQQKDKFFVRRNEGIRIPQVLLVEDGVKLGVFKTADALRMARDKGLDLVEVAPHAKPHPVCSIMDYGKYRFEMQQKKKKQEKNSGPKEKEISFRYVIDDHDLQTKVNQIKGYLEKGDRVKIRAWSSSNSVWRLSPKLPMSKNNPASKEDKSLPG